MKINKIKSIIMIFLVVVLFIIIQTIGETDDNKTTININNQTIENTPKLTIKYTPLGVPNINNSFKTWMSYKAVTNKNSPQYKFIHTYGWSDSEGFMRCSGERDLGVEQDYYLIAIGSYYGTDIGAKYRITLDTGRVFYGALADSKNNKHTNSTNQYIPKNGNMVEFLVDTSKLNKEVKKMGSANVYMPLNGQIVKIERMEFVVK